MAVPEVTINYLPVLISAILAFVVGGLWYSPILFANIWVKGSNIDMKKMENAKNKGMAKSYLITFLGSLLTAYILTHFVQYLSTETFLDGMQAGFYIWLGFVAPLSLEMVLWENKTLGYYFVNVGYHLVTLTLMAGILTVWN